MLRPTALVGSLLLVPLAACSTGGAPGEAECAGGKCDEAGENGDPSLCAAVRGNGQLISAHFASLARIVEHYGLLGGASGGSSASISVFLTESVQANPLVYQCGKSACTPRESAARAALLLKSLQGYLEFLSTTGEAVAARRLAPLIEQVQTEGVEALLEEDADAAVAALLEILESEDVRDLINPEIVELLQSSPAPAFHARDVLAGIEELGSFDTDSDRILIRPGLLHFEALAEKLGRVASFYAGYGPADEARMEQFLGACAASGRGLNWREVAQLPAGDTSCGALFASLLADYREAFVEDRDPIHSRVDDPIGAFLPALISTSVLEGGAAAAWREARAAYLAGEGYSFAPSFSEVRFGYWGRAEDLERVGDNPNGYGDLQTEKFLSLGEATWREALSYSPAEPGLARALELGGELVSAGGWSDLQPVLALKNMGCDKVVYVTRTGEQSRFAQGVARLLGMSEEEETALYDLGADSSFSRALGEADGVWCTNWDDLPALDIQAVSEDAYSAPLETRDPFFTGGEDAYPGAAADIGKPGCTPPASGR